MPLVVPDVACMFLATGRKPLVKTNAVHAKFSSERCPAKGKIGGHILKFHSICPEIAQMSDEHGIVAMLSPALA